jgi:CheY-like chemotaxis protein
LGIERVLTKPVKQSDLLDAVTRLFGASTRDEKGERQELDVSPKEVRPMRVLLAEDGRINQMVAIKLLEDRGHNVVLAHDGQIAVDIHAERTFDAILMDVQMPRMDGYAATKAIRKREKKTGAHIPIIAMTANAMKGDRERCLEAGMDDYVAKPVRAAELMAILEKHAPVEADRGEPANAGMAKDG